MFNTSSDRLDHEPRNLYTEDQLCESIRFPKWLDFGLHKGHCRHSANVLKPSNVGYCAGRSSNLYSKAPICCSSPHSVVSPIICVLKGQYEEWARLVGARSRARGRGSFVAGGRICELFMPPSMAALAREMASESFDITAGRVLRFLEGLVANVSIRPCPKKLDGGIQNNI
jgi:hypothetical protein